jgi:hypothetical protein
MNDAITPADVFAGLQRDSVDALTRWSSQFMDANRATKKKMLAAFFDALAASEQRAETTMLLIGALFLYVNKTEQLFLYVNESTQETP